MYNHMTVHNSIIQVKQSLLKQTVLPKTFKYTLKANPKQKHVETTQGHEKGRLLLGDSPWRDDLLAVASKHCPLPHSRSPWRTDGEKTLLPVTF